jgi:hypothetical protein
MEGGIIAVLSCVTWLLVAQRTGATLRLLRISVLL